MAYDRAFWSSFYDFMISAATTNTGYQRLSKVDWIRVAAMFDDYRLTGKVEGLTPAEAELLGTAIYDQWVPAHGGRGPNKDEFITLAMQLFSQSGSDGGNGDIAPPSDGIYTPRFDPVAWAKANPLMVAGIGLGLYVLLAPKKKRRRGGLNIL